ncbi:Glutathione S-transferase [Rhynchospora pubera]|uniref:glutathione transferase n=1 Tax=Rhynchospora pubera TaxID=906938 RepID=A0AAV8DJH4_9POAL|nr:Glutathione S-transferase [Rhynchospora pubera]
MSGVKLYGSPMSTCTARVLLCLEEVGAEYELVPVSTLTGEQKSPAHLARNPFGQIPALEDGDLVLFESRAISRYVLRKYQASGADLLKEENFAESALVDVWLEAEAQQYNPAIQPIIFQFFVVPRRFGVSPDQAIIDSSLEKLKKVLEVYEVRLSKSKYLAGDFFSLADLSHFPYTKYFMATPYASVFESYPHVKAWWDDITSRPAFKKVAASMHGS